MKPRERGDGWELHRGDCLGVAAGLEPSSFALIYIDPPFFTGARRSGERGAYGDAWGNDVARYTDHIGERIAAMKPLLHERGSILVHLDWRAVHYVKVRCDAIFGANRFMNEIVWSYNSGGGSKKRYGRKHDTILWYGAGPNPVFNADAARVPYDAVIAKKRAHLFHERGKVSGDVLDVSRPPNHAKEWVGWPDQKPLALLDRLVRVHTNEGDRVGDFFCGSGTTLVAAVAAGRSAVGADISEDALRVSAERLAGAGR